MIPPAIAPVIRKTVVVWKSVIFDISKNAILNHIQQLVSRIECWMDCDGQTYTASVTVFDNRRIIRRADPRAIKTIILNHGDYMVYVFEDSLPVLMVPPNSSRQIPMYGKLLVEASTTEGHECAIDITVIRRCNCGDDELPHLPIPSTGGELI